MEKKIIFDYNNVMNPLMQKKTYSDGSYYIGQLRNNKREGEGIYYFIHGVNFINFNIIIIFLNKNMTFLYLCRRYMGANGKMTDFMGLASIYMTMERFMREN